MDKKFLGLMSIFMISFVLFVMSVFLSKTDFMNRLTKAESKFVPSPKTSLILIYPLQTQADGESKVKIDVFVRNDIKDHEPEAINNKKVRIITTLGQLDKPEITTDQAGQASFYLTSNTPGTANITAIVDGSITLNAKVSVEFK